MSDEELEVKTPSGWGAVLRGSSVQCVVVLALCGAAVVYVLNEHDSKAAERAAHIESALESFAKAAQRQAEQQESTNYLLSRPQKEREELNLAKPKALRDMER